MIEEGMRVRLAAGLAKLNIEDYTENLMVVRDRLGGQFYRRSSAVIYDLKLIMKAANRSHDADRLVNLIEKLADGQADEQIGGGNQMDADQNESDNRTDTEQNERDKQMDAAVLVWITLRYWKRRIVGYWQKV